MSKHLLRSASFRVLEYVEFRIGGASLAETSRDLGLSILDIIDAVRADPWLAIEGDIELPEIAFVCMDLT